MDTVTIEKRIVVIGSLMIDHDFTHYLSPPGYD